MLYKYYFNKKFMCISFKKICLLKKKIQFVNNLYHLSFYKKY